MKTIVFASDSVDCSTISGLSCKKIIMQSCQLCPRISKSQSCKLWPVEQLERNRGGCKVVVYGAVPSFLPMMANELALIFDDFYSVFICFFQLQSASPLGLRQDCKDCKISFSRIATKKCNPIAIVGYTVASLNTFLWKHMAISIPQNFIS